MTVATLATAMPNAPAKADFAAGLKAYDAGKYRSAYIEWYGLAVNGDVAAQVALAGLFRRGEGMPVNPGIAARWYLRAARAGDAIAQLNLGEMYQKGEGVGRNLRRAYLWLSLAAQQGNSDATARLDALKEKMSQADIKAATRDMQDKANWR